MSARDAKGRFVSADVAAAERVLEAAVLESVRLIRSNPRHGRTEAQVLFYAAGTAADLLLSERAS